jgi:hypothetical protein
MLTARDLRDCFRDRLVDENWVADHEMRGLIPIILNGILRKSVLFTFVLLSNTYYRAPRGE